MGEYMRSARKRVEGLMIEMKYLRGSAGRFCREFEWRLRRSRLPCHHPWVHFPAAIPLLPQTELAPSILLESIAGFLVQAGPVYSTLFYHTYMLLSVSIYVKFMNLTSLKPRCSLQSI